MFEEIIIEIQTKPEVWMSSHPLYKNRLVKAKVWKELAAKLNMEEDTLKQRWKHLKDLYRKELMKQPLSRSGAEAADWESTWQYFQIMSFIKDDMLPGPSSGILSSSQDCEIDDDEDTEMTTPGMSPQPSPSITQILPRKRTTIREAMLEIERKKLKLIEQCVSEGGAENVSADEDELYFKSLLPQLRKMTNVQRFKLRGKINEWMLEAMLDNEDN